MSEHDVTFMGQPINDETPREVLMKALRVALRTIEQQRQWHKHEVEMHDLFRKAERGIHV